MRTGIARSLLFLVFVIGLMSCIPKPRQLGPVVQRGQCGRFALDIEHVWNAHAAGSVRAGFVGVGVQYSEDVAERVVTQMDNITRDWVMLSEQSCRDLEEDKMSRPVYTARRSCLDSWLLRLRGMTSVLGKPDKDMAEKVLDALQRLSDEAAECVRQSATLDVQQVQPTRATGAAAELIARANIELQFGRTEQASTALQQAAQLADNNHTVLADAALARARVSLLKREYAEAEANAREALGTYEESKDTTGKVEAMTLLADLHFRQGRYREAYDTYSTMVPLARQVLGETSSRLVTLENGQGRVLLRMQRADQAIAVFRSLLDRVEHEAERRPLVVSSVRHNLAYALSQAGRYNEASEQYNEVIRAEEQVLGPQHPSTAATRHNLGVLLMRRGEMTTALESLSLAREARMRAYGIRNIEVARTESYMALVFQWLGRSDEGAEALRGVVSVFVRELGRNHPETLGAYNRAALFHLMRNETTEALSAARTAAEIAEAVGESGGNNTFWAKVNLGRAKMYVGEYDEGLTLANQGIEALRAKVGPQHIELADALMMVGMTQLQLNHAEKALPLLRESQSIRERVLGQTSPVLAAIHGSIVQALIATQRESDAVEDLDITLAVFDPLHLTDPFAQGHTARLHHMQGILLSHSETSMDRALAELNQALTMHKQLGAAWAADANDDQREIARIQAATGKGNEALETLTQLVNEHAQDPTALVEDHLTRADVLATLHRPAEQQQALALARSLFSRVRNPPPTLVARMTATSSARNTNTTARVP